MILPLLNIDKVRLYSDTEHTAVISVEGWTRRGKVSDNGQEHFFGVVCVQHIKDSLRQDFLMNMKAHGPHSR